jgi:hypothetical protein
VSALGEHTRPNPSSVAELRVRSDVRCFLSQTFPLERYHHILPSSTTPYTLPPSSIMTEYVKVEKIVPKFPPPAFGDIAKASNDVCLGCLSRALE